MATRSGLRREVGFLGLTFVSFGAIIGSGWLLAAMTAAQAAGPAALLSWLLAAVIIGIIALLLAELGSAYPLAGGSVRFPHLAFGPLTGFTLSWLYWLITLIGPPIEAEVTLYYLDHQVHGFIRVSGGAPVLTGRGLALAAVLVIVFAVINVLGVRSFSGASTLLAWFKIAVPSLIVVSLLTSSFHPGNFHAGGGFAPGGLHAILEALPLGVVFSLTGFDQNIQLGGEARWPGRDLGRSLLLALGLATVLYLLLQVAFLGAVDPRNVAGGWAAPLAPGNYGPFATLASTLGLGWLTTLIYVAACVSPAGSGLIVSGTSSRIGFALSRNGYLPEAFETVDRRGVPVFSVCFGTAVGMLVLLPFPSWQRLVVLISAGAGLVYAFVPVSFAALRRTDPGQNRPFRVWAGGVLAPLGFAAASLVFYWAGWEADWKVLAAVATGYPVLVFTSLLNGAARRPEFDRAALRSSAWMWPYFAGMALLSHYGQYGGTGALPFGWDIAAVSALSFVIFQLAVRLRLPAQRVACYVSVGDRGPATTPLEGARL
ncbi:APC family permease [Microbispora sp. ATCC PTA-5024]|uniref:APC family permease n=1 Tax=Microbispora sp. ATCC PTA-5024 TaxID=316330 RepID=UPI0003DD44B9|nr:APC family permease [Microbispora sp. ATCC PTA-5024]ETK32817.1 hypothetical protein MPTA5024_27715 [Microbispora sp. ATCC PTA-5024]